ncbi:aldehyde dehydrogenase [Laetiporus sulphureus 93-53]|uniref:Aldehyde dehydrogenase n=1 Tax=Laetiporus sulphureus 93-53 TaxID=1314785 RepID=A0A165DG43_9APHY|nr:aldehyde dehydrogenase [Laetiporus sulphureus 93-53]KZT04818.1 aldehyde dehydrogenase [Laetiporus sulphureus 93-53]
MVDSLPCTSLFIDGQYRPASTGETFSVLKPGTRTVIGYAAAATSKDCEDAIASAARAFDSWEHSALSLRRNILIRAAELLKTQEYRERAAKAMKEETSATPLITQFDLFATSESLMKVAGMITMLKGETFASRMPGGQTFTQKRAMGVIYAIAPWNVPLILTVRAVAIPIVCGNTVLLKLSDVSPRVQSVITDVLHEAGLPAGVLNVISTRKEDAAALTAEIIAHPAVRTINFTGSDTVAKSIAAEAAKHLKPCVFELGGKAPVIVLDDADIAHATRAITAAAFIHSGQFCMATERVIVQRSVAPVLIASLTNLFGRIHAGNDAAFGTAVLGADGNNRGSIRLGPLFSEGSAENVVRMIEEARGAGAEVLVGDAKRDGTIVQPHLVLIPSTLKDKGTGLRIWQRESFGPVIVVVETDSVDEAVELANASEYSLMAGLWTRDVNRAFDVAARIRAGSVNINGETAFMEGDLGGLGGASGYGRFNVDNFTDTRVLTFHPSTEPPYPLLKGLEDARE